jgi:hypothetical protein
VESACRVKRFTTGWLIPLRAFESHRWCPTRLPCWNCDRSNCAVGGQVDSSWQEDNDSIATALECSYGLACSIMRHCLKFRKVCALGAQRTEGSRKTWAKCICPCNFSNGMRMKEKICLTVSVLGTNHVCIATNTNKACFNSMEIS